MKRSIARQWAKALESGNYKQAIMQLRNKHNGFCCLGVLCNLHAQAHPEIAQLQTSKESYMEETAELPQAVQDWAGMRTAHGQVNEKFSLMDLNDLEERSFSEIAKIIRREWKKL